MDVVTYFLNSGYQDRTGGGHIITPGVIGGEIWCDRPPSLDDLVVLDENKPRTTDHILTQLVPMFFRCKIFLLNVKRVCTKIGDWGSVRLPCK